VRAATTPADQAESTGLRLTFLALLVVSLFVLLFARLWFLQVMAGERFTAQAQGNAVRTVTLEAPRGKILDRDGETLVRNRYAAVVSVQPDEMGERREEVYAALADMLALDVEEVARRAESTRTGPFRPRPIAIDVDLDVVSYIHENGAAMFPGVYAETLPLRDYPHGPLAAHVVGYLGEISEAQLDSDDYEGYRPGDLLGWSGVEQVREADLRGTNGARRLEVDARGRVLRDLGDTPAVPGGDVRLTLDLQVQQAVEQALAEGIAAAREKRDTGSGPGRGGTYKAPAGAAVVIDPRNGEVIAMASHPTFEPADFVGGISQGRWDVLQDPENHFPLINRAIQSSYPPGSVFKIIPAAAALEEGYLAMGETLPCTPAWSWGTTVYRNWNRGVHEGQMDLADSLVRSCDTVYYELARRMWLDEEAERGDDRERLPDHARAWGLGQRTGIDLPSERAGVVPGRQWKQDYWEATREVTCRQAQEAEEGSYARDVLTDLCNDGNRWRGGDAVNMSIGQGDVQTTPLQIANAFAAVANRGTLYVPHVTREVVRPDGTVEPVEPEVLAELPVSRAHLDYIHQGLVGVNRRDSHPRGGTGAGVFADFPIPVAGKTGTAEYKPKQPIAWYAAYAPAEAPRYVVAVMVEEGGGGSLTAAPIARRIFEALFPAVEESEIAPGTDIQD
jgi:penicillin-binding protein 2